MTDTNQHRLDRTLQIIAHGWIASLIFSIFVAEILAIVLGLLWLWRRRDERRNLTALDYSVLLLLLLRLLTIATAIAPAASLPALRKIPFMLVFFPLADFAWRQKSPEVVNLLRTLVVAAVMASIYGLVKIAMQGSHRLYSTTSGPTTLAMFLAAGFVVGLALFGGDMLKKRKFWMTGLASTLVAMAFTYCRAPWLAACAVGLSLLLMHARRKAVPLLVAVIVILAALPNFRMRYEEVLQWPHAMGDRPVIWQKGWELVQARPLLGYGPASFDLLFDRRDQLKDRRVGAWHNFALQLWVESGVVSLLAFGFILWKVFTMGTAGLRRAVLPETRAADTALLAGSTTLLLAGLFGGLIGDPIVDMLFWGMLGMVAGLEEKRN
jgi:O-antigen ligase